MRAIFGIVSLLVVLAVVGVLVSRQMTASASRPAVAGTAQGASDASAGVDTGGSPKQMQERLQADLNKALDQAAKIRADEVDK